VAKKKPVAEKQVSTVALAQEIAALRQRLREAEDGLIATSNRLTAYANESSDATAKVCQRVGLLERYVYHPIPKRGFFARLFGRRAG
jgi:hypothetical protein